MPGPENTAQHHPGGAARPRGPLRRWVGPAVGLVALAVYLATVAPTLTWAHQSSDGGDLITAAHVLGVPHPPGYPLYVLVGHLFDRAPLLPGDLALRFNLLSALGAAGAAAFLGAAIARLKTPLAGLVGGLAGAFGPFLWSQAVVAEVYALNALLVAALLYTVLRLPSSGTPGNGGPSVPRSAGLAIGVLWGLGWTTHLTTAFLLPVVLWAGRRLDAAGRARLLVGWLAGLSLFLLLPVLAAGQPVINWGDPVTPERWWWVVSGALYRGYPFGLPLAGWPGRLAALARFALEHLTWPGLGLAMWGAAQVARKDRFLGAALLSAAALITIYALGYDTTDSHMMLIPVWMVGAIFLGAGAASLPSSWRAVRWLSLGIPLYLLLSGWSAADLRGDRSAAEFGRSVMAGAPPGALVYTSTDAHTFALWYYRHAEGQRPDLTIVDQEMLSQGWYQTVLRAQDETWTQEQGGRPVCTVSLDGELICRD